MRKRLGFHFLFAHVQRGTLGEISQVLLWWWRFLLFPLLGNRIEFSVVPCVTQTRWCESRGDIINTKKKKEIACERKVQKKPVCPPPEFPLFFHLPVLISTSSMVGSLGLASSSNLFFRLLVLFFSFASQIELSPGQWKSNQWVLKAMVQVWSQGEEVRYQWQHPFL